LRDFEKGDEELLSAKNNRSQIEYYFTCTPSLPIYIFRNHSEVDVITYLDADLFFFSNPSPIYDELGDNSILIVGHRFPPRLKDMESHGIYNVGLLSFRKDANGLQCINWWRQRCLDWCYDRVENGKFADQKYLDDWPTRFPGIVVLQHKGAGLAPWNVANYSFSLKNGMVNIDSQPLVYFHFHTFKQISRLLYDPNFKTYKVHSNFMLKKNIYTPYIRQLNKIGQWLSRFINQSDIKMGSIRTINPSRPSNINMWHPAKAKIRQQLAIAKKVLQGDLWVVICGKVL